MKKYKYPKNLQVYMNGMLLRENADYHRTKDGIKLDMVFEKQYETLYLLNIPYLSLDLSNLDDKEITFHIEKLRLFPYKKREIKISNHFTFEYANKVEYNIEHEVK